MSANWITSIGPCVGRRGLGRARKGGKGLIGCPRPARPPLLNAAALAAVPWDHREDAIQEAWLAWLEGKHPKAAVHRMVRQILRQQELVRSFSDLDAKGLLKILRM